MISPQHEQSVPATGCAGCRQAESTGGGCLTQEQTVLRIHPKLRLDYNTSINLGTPGTAVGIGVTAAILIVGLHCHYIIPHGGPQETQ